MVYKFNTHEWVLKQPHFQLLHDKKVKIAFSLRKMFKENNLLISKVLMLIQYLSVWVWGSYYEKGSKDESLFDLSFNKSCR